ncbi:uncharacterized protein PMUG01_00051300 [Plasmodium malariae]|uniref:Uncharacterized protein n=2 Tax=Plasmodium malariae TaxID=5858 RepID=A0A1D3JH91_PLAMA|nr:uncharacterized protein PMUG01_00051300 [Plasmodium malariae]SBT85690.1 hypothetical protein PMUG01_00051300 [Plasmodium malariae]
MFSINMYIHEDKTEGKVNVSHMAHSRCLRKVDNYCFRNMNNSVSTQVKEEEEDSHSKIQNKDDDSDEMSNAVNDVIEKEYGSGAIIP